MITIQQREPDFPKRLFRLRDVPEQLFVNGTIPVGPSVALIGTRKPDARMIRFAHDLAADLSGRGVAIISGGAAGIDTAAHRGALAAKGQTIAVLGSGFHYAYPAQNRHLFETISSTGGCVISEFEPSTPPSRWTFPRRNRIVAALSQAVIVIQASGRSGALITAQCAREIGIPVGAVPAASGDPAGVGCNRLLRGGATFVESAEDVISVMGKDVFRDQMLLFAEDSKRENSRQVRDRTCPTAELTENEIAILAHLGFDPVHIDAIGTGTGLPVHVVTAALMTLELSGFVQDLGGKRFVRTAMQ